MDEQNKIAFKLVRVVRIDDKLEDLEIPLQFYHPYFVNEDPTNFDHQRLIFSDDFTTMIDI